VGAHKRAVFQFVHVVLEGAQLAVGLTLRNVANLPVAPLPTFVALAVVVYVVTNGSADDFLPLDLADSLANFREILLEFPHVALTVVQLSLL